MLLSLASGTCYAEDAPQNAVKTDGPLFTCQLSPIRFEFYVSDEANRSNLLIFRDGKVTLSSTSELDVQGSGVCRHSVWSFDYEGFVQITELACYGEVEPPETAVGYISFDESDPYKRWFWCDK